MRSDLLTGRLDSVRPSPSGTYGEQGPFCAATLAHWSTRIIAESQGNGGFSLADSQSFDLNVSDLFRKEGCVLREFT